MRGWKNIFHANGKQNKAGVAIIVSDKIDLKIKNITRDKEGYYIMIKGSIQEEDIEIDVVISINKTKIWFFEKINTQHRSTSTQKTNTNRQKRRN